MQLAYIPLMTILLFGFSLSAAALSSKNSSAESKWRQVSDSEVLIDVTLPSGIEVKNIRYINDALGRRWVLQIKSTSGTMIRSNDRYLSGLPYKDFERLFTELVFSIKNNNDGQLDGVQIGLGFVNELWEGAASYLKNGEIPGNYKLKAKDYYLASRLISNIERSSVLENLCYEAVKIQRLCKDNFVSMNPVTFEPDYIDKEWSQVEMLPNAGIPTENLWFGLSLSKMGNGEK